MGGARKKGGKGGAAAPVPLPPWLPPGKFLMVKKMPSGNNTHDKV